MLTRVLFVVVIAGAGGASSLAGQTPQVEQLLSIPDTSVGECVQLPAEIVSRLRDSLVIVLWRSDHRALRIQFSEAGEVVRYSETWIDDAQMERTRIEREDGTLAVASATSGFMAFTDSVMVERARAVGTEVWNRCKGLT